MYRYYTVSEALSREFNSKQKKFSFIRKSNVAGIVPRNPEGGRRMSMTHPEYR